MITIVSVVVIGFLLYKIVDGLFASWFEKKHEEYVVNRTKRALQNKDK